MADTEAMRLAGVGRHCRKYRDDSREPVCSKLSTLDVDVDVNVNRIERKG